MPQIKTSFLDKLKYAMTLIFSLGPPIVLFFLGYENKQKSLIIASVFLFPLNVYAIYKVYQNSKSVFVFCNLDTASKKKYYC